MFDFLKSSNRGQLLSEAYSSSTVPPTPQYNTNNQYSKFPPLTADGRNVIASWQPGAVVNEAILRENNIQSNWQYRRYMTNNANQIRAKLFDDALNDVGYTVRNENKEIQSSPYNGPKRYGSLLEPTTHEHAELSDLKDNYLSREQLQSKMVVPSLTQAQLVQLHK
jgi:hypothetical protein